MYQVGIDIGGTTVKMGLFLENGELLIKNEIPTRKELGWETVHKDMVANVHFLLEQRGEKIETLKGIGIGIPGVVSKDGVSRGAGNLGQSEIPVKELFQQSFPMAQIEVVNDANAATLGETYFGGAKGYENVVLLTFGTGIGGGIISEGKLLTGTKGIAGELGHILVNPKETETCGCGRCGCIEQYVSATGITRLAQKRLQKSLSAKDLFDLAKNGNSEAEAVVEEATDYLGLVMANLACVLEPEIFLIGGGMSKAGEYWRQLIEKSYRKYSWDATKEIPIRFATLGNDAGIHGAVSLVL